MSEDSGMSSWGNMASGSAAFGGAIATGVGNRRALKYSQRNFNTAMAFNERMANTQYQRGVADLRAAGLNPLLAYTQGAAGMPTVAQPAPVNEGAGVAQAGASAYSAAVQGQLAKKQMENVEAQTDKTSAEAELLRAQIPFSGQSAMWNSEKVFHELRKLAQEVDNLGIEGKIKQFDLEEYKPLVSQYQRLLNQAEELGLSEKKATSDFFETVPQSKWLEIVRQLLWRSR